MKAVKMAEEERSNITFPIPEWACPIFTTTGKLGVVICEIIEHRVTTAVAPTHRHTGKSLL